MVNFISSEEHVFVLLLLLGTAHIAISYDEGGDVIPPGDEDNWEEVDPEPPEYTVPKGVQTLSFNPANLTDEDQHSFHMPRDLVCDGCRIIAYQIAKQLKRIQIRYKKGHKLSESDVIDIIDKICTNDKEIFNSYGIKDVDGQRRLSGEGLETKDKPGILQGGGRWPYRLQQMCAAYVDNLGEDKIYDHFLAGDSLEDLICQNKMEGVGIACVPKQGQKKPSSTKAKEDL